MWEAVRVISKSSFGTHNPSYHQQNSLTTKDYIDFNTDQIIILLFFLYWLICINIAMVMKKVNIKLNTELFVMLSYDTGTWAVPVTKAHPRREKTHNELKKMRADRNRMTKIITFRDEFKKHSGSLSLGLWLSCLYNFVKRDFLIYLHSAPDKSGFQ